MKRIIFAVLYDRGNYVLSRNFRRQQIGRLDWLLQNYRLLDVSMGLDELMILNVGDDRCVDAAFLADVGQLSRSCFVPVTAGGGVRSIADAERLLEVGVDKVLLNQPFHDDPALCEAVAGRFGSQFLIQGIDVVRESEGSALAVVRRDGPAPWDVAQAVARGRETGAGEVLIQSVTRDGTGRGIEPALLAADAVDVTTPLVVMGGVGRASHIEEALHQDHVDAVATANILNFIGDAFVRIRADLIDRGMPLPTHDGPPVTEMRDALREQG